MNFLLQEWEVKESEAERKIKRKESKETEETVHRASTITGKGKTISKNIFLSNSFRAFEINSKNDKPIRLLLTYF